MYRTLGITSGAASVDPLLHLPGTGRCRGFETIAAGERVHNGTEMSSALRGARQEPIPTRVHQTYPPHVLPAVVDDLRS